MRRVMLLTWAMCCLFFCTMAARAAEAEDLSGKELVTECRGFSNIRQLFDGRTMDPVKIRQGCSVTLTHEKGIASLYLVFDRECGGYTVTDQETRKTVTFGGTGFLREFLDLEAAFGTVPSQVTLSFDQEDVALNELSAFSSGQVPDWVQRWEEPAEGAADLVLFSTHGDDEQLFFAGMLPYYAAERGYEVQVVYLTGHQNMSQRRMHEMLEGLWAVGVRHYPVFGPFGDYNSRSLAEAYQKYGYKGVTREDLLAYAVENVRRFRPKVAVGHDLKGEYGHGMHMVYADVLSEAVEISADAGQFPESAEIYGLWEVPKTYLHLYPEHPVVMDWDIPLESFGGMTAFEVTRDLGFPCHASQQRYYSWYFTGKKAASEITEYSPCEFGLYRSTVGEDLEKNDLFEHVTSHAQDREAMEAERLAREEKARRKAEQESLAREQTVPSATEKIPEEPVSQENGWAVFWKNLLEKVLKK